ncbi:MULTISPECIES: tetratricopeptide repeat-containing sulfotransferase family protein [Rhodanobacter]|uniref:tetratricopeptide repeat-containing sulfotransferase family protein n=1 Tax=Rhodanobacter TaxID=75309 RepID=UPI00040ACD75|nr:MULTISPECIES: tetratricopeptide repeat-containing sulfotransferase family protein [Rhodanobacter]TAN15718.1 MAG: sulfotransferase family protein [Rhodanobacter sp.]UJJ55836.1 sulfotransferase [Rhodanobacter thiooxydans]
MTSAPAIGTLEQALAHAARLLERDPALAIGQLDEILQAAAGHPVALQLLAAARSLQGDLQGALDILVPLAQAQPAWAMVHADLGLALGRCGRGQEAIAALRRAVALKPDLPQAWRALGDHLMAAGEQAAADAAYASHVRYSTRDPRLLAAAVALVENRIPEAETRLREHLKQAPTDVAAIRMFAEVAARLGRNEDALHLLERCLELAPGFHEARRNYALLLHRANRPEQALAELARLLAADPEDAGSRNLKAAVLCRTGDYEQAIGIYAALLERHPDQPKLWVSQGHALKTAGHTERAIAAYRRSLELEPSFGEVWWSLANLKTFRFGADELAAMRAQLARTDLAEDDRLHLEFAIGKALEDAGEYESSFRHYAQGNAIRRGQVHYSADDTSARVRYICAHYTREFFAARAGAGSPAPDPIFVVGLPRAGSTLIEQILSSHSQVEGTMELPEVTSIARLLRMQGDADEAMPYHGALAALDADALRALGERYLEHTRIQRKTAAPLFIDKMPNNFMHIGLIQLMLPKAKIIDARRHPLACGFSAFKQHFARGQGFSYELADIGRYYRDYVALMAHFDAVLPGRIHRVVYERMVEDTEGEVRRLLDYCGLPFEASCLRFFQNPRPVRTASSEQVRQPIYREGVDHWRHYAAWLGPLASPLGPVLQRYPDVPV